ALLSILFFSSRRRHTRFSRDWSSDVCSSDLPRLSQIWIRRQVTSTASGSTVSGLTGLRVCLMHQGVRRWYRSPIMVDQYLPPIRSEERRVGIESSALMSNLQ